MTFSRSVASALLAVSVICCLAGCGTSEYERRLNAFVNDAETNSVFNTLEPPTTLPGTQVSVRLPIPLPKQDHYKLLDGSDASARRIKLPGTELVDMKAAYEYTITDQNGGRVPYYIMFGVVKKEGRMADYARSFTLSMQQIAQDNASTMGDLTDASPSGKSNTWQLIRVKSKTEYPYFNPQQKEEYQNLEVSFVGMIRDAGDKFYYIVWKVPQAYEAFAKIQHFMPLVAGCMVGE